MKNKILLMSLFVVSLIWLVGCASDGGTVNNQVSVKMRRKVPLPPMPPGFDAKKQKALDAKRLARETFVPASSTVPGFPPMRLIDFGDIWLASAEQGTNHATVMFTSETVNGPEYEIANYDCNTGGEVQWVAAGVSKAYPMLYIEAKDRDCGAGFMPAAAPEPTVGTGRQVIISGITNGALRIPTTTNWVLRLPDRGPVPRFILKKAK